MIPYDFPKWRTPHAIAVTTADVTDRKGALDAFKNHHETLCGVKSALLDEGYTGQPLADEICG